MGDSSSPKPAPALPPCRVCGSKATGLHYGANTCEACKGFFSRGLSEHNKYVCVGNRTCEIWAGRYRRKSCQYCRYQRCVQVGMSKNAIKTGRYTQKKRAADRHEIEKLSDSKRCSPSSSSDPQGFDRAITAITPPTSTLTDEYQGVCYSNANIKQNIINQQQQQQQQQRQQQQQQQHQHHTITNQHINPPSLFDIYANPPMSENRPISRLHTTPMEAKSGSAFERVGTAIREGNEVCNTYNVPEYSMSDSVSDKEYNSRNNFENERFPRSLDLSRQVRETSIDASVNLNPLLDGNVSGASGFNTNMFQPIVKPEVLNNPSNMKMGIHGINKPTLFGDTFTNSFSNQQSFKRNELLDKLNSKHETNTDNTNNVVIRESHGSKIQNMDVNQGQTSQTFQFSGKMTSTNENREEMLKRQLRERLSKMVDNYSATKIEVQPPTVSVDSKIVVQPHIVNVDSRKSLPDNDSDNSQDHPYKKLATTFPKKRDFYSDAGLNSRHENKHLVPFEEFQRYVCEPTVAKSRKTSVSPEELTDTMDHNMDTVDFGFVPNYDNHDTSTDVDASLERPQSSQHLSPNKAVSVDDFTDEDCQHFRTEAVDSFKKNNKFLEFMTDINEYRKYQRKIYEDNKLARRMFGDLRPIAVQEYENIYNATGIDIDEREPKKMHSHMNFMWVLGMAQTFLVNLPGYLENIWLHQYLILKNAFVMIEMIFSYRGANIELELIPDFKGECRSVEQPLCSYREYDRLFIQLADKLQKFGASLEEDALMSAVCAFMTDTPELDDIASVRRLRAISIRCLREEFRATRGDNHEHVFSECWAFLQELRSLRTVYGQYVSVLKHEWPEMAKSPLVLAYT